MCYSTVVEKPGKFRRPGERRGGGGLFSVFTKAVFILASESPRENPTWSTPTIENRMGREREKNANIARERGEKRYGGRKPVSQDSWFFCHPGYWFLESWGGRARARLDEKVAEYFSFTTPGGLGNPEKLTFKRDRTKIGHFVSSLNLFGFE